MEYDERFIPDGMNGFERNVKRIVDCMIAVILMILFSPLFLICYLAVKSEDGGPAIFKQERIGRFGRPFYIYKFRSMRLDAEKHGPALYAGGKDGRLTRIGKFLREHHLDELPQLFNIFFGSMSVVGPRPCVSYELGDYDTLNKKYKKRFQVKGGITGLAQCKGRNENSWDEKVTFDGQYVDLFKSEGVWVDIKILWWSVIKVFQSANINEDQREGMSAEESAELDDDEVKRIAHLPDEE